MNADLRSTTVNAQWSGPDIPGVDLAGAADSISGIAIEIRWNGLAFTLQLADGPAIDVSAGGSFTLACSVSTISVNVTPAALPPAGRTRQVWLSAEVWNHAIFRYASVFKEVRHEGDEMYVEIKTEILGNRDTPFPPEAAGTVNRTYTYRIEYNSLGETTTNRAKWGIPASPG